MFFYSIINVQNNIRNGFNNAYQLTVKPNCRPEYDNLKIGY